MNNFVKSLIIPFIKFVLIFGIFAFLFWRTSQSDAFEQLMTRSKNWGDLVLTFLFFFIALIFTFIRWQWLVLALGIPFGFSEMLKLGFLGQIFNYLPVGIIGGDVVKGCLLARGKSGAGAKIAASVIMDRLIGLYVMFLIGFAAIWFTGLYNSPSKEAKTFVNAVIILFAGSTVGMGFLLWPESRSGFRRRITRKIPFIGSLLVRLLEAVQIYRSKWLILLPAFAITFGVHFFFSLGIYYIACGLFGTAPSVWDHLAIYPIGNTASMIPLSIGPLEAFLDILYPLFDIPGADPYQAGYGMVIGIGYRIISLLIAGIGGIYYIFSKSELADVRKEMKKEPSEELPERSDNDLIDRKSEEKSNISEK